MSAQKRMLAHVERAIALVDPYAVPAATTGAPAAASERAPRHLDPAARGALRRELQP